MVASSASVTALKWWFAAEMRRMREKAGLTREQAASAVRGSVANMGHIETARGLPKPLELERLLQLYGEPERDEFFQDLRLRAKRGRDSGSRSAPYRSRAGTLMSSPGCSRPTAGPTSPGASLP